jgi:hypothetical protein
MKSIPWALESENSSGCKSHYLDRLLTVVILA